MRATLSGGGRFKAYSQNGLQEGKAALWKERRYHHARLDLCRSTKTNKLNAGLDAVYRNKIQGHALEGMDRHCLVVTDDTVKEAMDKYTAWLDGQI